MMIKYLIIFLFCTLFCSSVHPQTAERTSSVGIPMESIFVHKNAEILFSGERLMYSIYVHDLSIGRASELSKIAYVELLGENLEPVFFRKIGLENGKGHDDFKLNTEVETGTYKLLAYTQLMKNLDVGSYFETDVFIINPYDQLPEKNSVTPATDSLGLSQETHMDDVGNANNKIFRTGNSSIAIELNGEKFGKREMAKVHVASKATLRGAVLSLSIRKKEEINGPTTISAMAYHSNRLDRIKNKTIDVNRIKWLPELRGDHISGRLLQGPDSLPITNGHVVLSIPGRQYKVDIARTDNNGRFGFWLESEQPVNRTGHLEVLGDVPNEPFILMDKEGPFLPADLTFEQYKIGRHLEGEILKRSIQNQLENAYERPIGEMSNRPSSNETPYYRFFETQYILDEYTRFSTTEETFIEVVEQAWIEKGASETPKFKVRPLQQYPQDIIEDPLVLLDGYVVLDHGQIIEIPAREIRSISVSRKKIFMGSKKFQGILHFESKSEMLGGQLPKENSTRIEIEGSSFFKGYPEFQYGYLSNKSKDIPDLRRQLYWNPRIKVDKETYDLDILTSDMTGEFEIRVEGFSSTGKPISGYQSFVVK